jgi:anti-sigma28 factor (negative regulator of flagellin synthesis)
MRVNDHNTTGASAAEAGRAQETQRIESGSASRVAASKSGGDRVELSSTSASISRTLSADGSERTAKVQELAAQYQSGRYTPDLAGASRGMVSEALAPALH